VSVAESEVCAAAPADDVSTINRVRVCTDSLPIIKRPAMRKVIMVKSLGSLDTNILKTTSDICSKE
jgi:hypothetical protein